MVKSLKISTQRFFRFFWRSGRHQRCQYVSSCKLWNVDSAKLLILHLHLHALVVRTDGVQVSGKDASCSWNSARVDHLNKSSSLALKTTFKLKLFIFLSILWYSILKLKKVLLISSLYVCLVALFFQFCEINCVNLLLMDQSEAAIRVKRMAFWQGEPTSESISEPRSDLRISRRTKSGLKAVLHNFRIPSTSNFSNNNSKEKDWRISNF